jgi:hypothetical protein
LGKSNFTSAYSHAIEADFPETPGLGVDYVLVPTRAFPMLPCPSALKFDQGNNEFFWIMPCGDIQYKAIQSINAII